VFAPYNDAAGSGAVVSHPGAELDISWARGPLAASRRRICLTLGRELVRIWQAVDADDIGVVRQVQQVVPGETDDALYYSIGEYRRTIGEFA
jgi:hypothetical protein